LAQLFADVSNQEYGKKVLEARTLLEPGLFLHTEPRNFIDRYVGVPGQELDDSFLLRWLVFRNKHWTLRIEVSVFERVLPKSCSWRCASAPSSWGSARSASGRSSFPVSLYDALVSIAVPTEKARAVIDAMEREMGATLATKADLLLFKQELRQEISELRQGLRQEISQLRQEVNQEFTLVRKEMELQRSSMIVRLGSIQVVAAGLLFAALKLT
jgi:hypothetical protein